MNYDYLCNSQTKPYQLIFSCMCTVTYLPTTQQGFILTSNRDEYSLRPTLPPQIYQIHGQTLCFPKDQQAGGTWVITHPQFTLCLLNGAFERHQRKIAYRQSRGKILTDFFQYQSIAQFLQQYDFEGIEAFTLIAIQHQTTQLHEIRWDEHEHLHHSTLQQQAHIWSSATLYAPTISDNRKRWFEDWLSNNPQPSANDIMQFHQFGGNGDPNNDLVMNRFNVVQTLSTTCIEYQPPSKHTIHYKDYLQQQTSQQHLQHLQQP